MKKIIILLLLGLLLVKNTTYSQIEISLDTIQLSDISYNGHNKFIILFDRYTPSNFNISLTNPSDSITKFNLSECKLYYHYIYKNNIYIRKLEDLFGEPLVTITPNSIKIQIIGVSLACLTPFDPKKTDYNKELSQILPTLRVFLIQKDNSIITSGPLKNLKIRKKYFDDTANIVYGDKNCIFVHRFRRSCYKNKIKIPNIIYY